MGRTPSGRKPVRIPYVAWRDGQPRFVPSASLRKLGYKGKSLRQGSEDEPGRWFTQGEAQDWSNAFAQTLQQHVDDDKKSRSRNARRGGKKRYGLSLGGLIDAYELGMRDGILAGTEDLTLKSFNDYVYTAKLIHKASPALWSTQADAVTKPQVFALYEAITARHGLSTGVKIVRVVSLIMGWGMIRGVIHREYNPAQGMRIKNPKPRVRVASLVEFEALLASADALDLPFIGDAIALGLFTGQRQGDRLALLLSGMDENGRYRFRQSKTGAIVAIKPTETLTARMDAALDRRKLRNEICPHVIMNELKWMPLDRPGDKTYSRLFATVRAHAAQTVPSVASLTDPDLRDTAVTYMARGGAKIADICAVTGHSLQSATTILRHYLELNADMADNGIDALVAHIDQLVAQRNRNSQ